MKAIKQLKFSIPSDLDALGNLLATFNSLKMDFIPEQDWLESQLALAEAFTNAVRHAHKNLDSSTQIEINIQIFRSYLEIYVWDHGESFDLIGLLEVLEKWI
ncbi:MAG: hypothetical protein HC796_11375 [Synechococcaceae cyanobacterium RL_1_2]|nr:hypothetical protein [Synechococcaceae cyanobacterium RL_1_2]